jgi:hypothetical protein
MKPSLLLVTVAGLFCGFAATFDATGAPAHAPNIRQIVDALVKQRFHVQARSG